MAFEQGQSGNPNGRPKGSKNKNTEQLRDVISEFLWGNFNKVEQELKKLEGKDYVKAYCDLLLYGLPKLQSMSLKPDFENMNNEQLDRIINALLEKQNG